MITNGCRWKSRLNTVAAEKLLVDLGTTCLTGLRACALNNAAPPARVTHPIYATLALSSTACASLGSDFQRAGLLFPPPTPDTEENFTDTYGVTWLWADGNPAQLEHPLQQAGWSDVSDHPRPQLPDMLQIASPKGASLVVADAPCAGLLDTCLALRNGWQFLDDITGEWQIASALLDWTLETVSAAYEHMLTALPEAPDIVVYADDLGFQGGMYLSDTDFRNHLYPRLKTLFSRLRSYTDAAICLHSCGGVRSILSDFADLGVEIMNLDFYAKGMSIEQVRRALPGDTILHGPVDLGALGAAVKRGDRAAVSRLATEQALAGPSIAAPADNIGEYGFLIDCHCGASSAGVLNVDDLRILKNVGPAKPIINKMIAAGEGTIPDLPGDQPEVATVFHTHPSSGHMSGGIYRAGNGRIN